MSEIVLLIAAVHALIPIIGSCVWKGSGWFLGTVLACGLACLTGASAYSVIDMVAALIGSFIGFKCLSKN